VVNFEQIRIGMGGILEANDTDWLEAIWGEVMASIVPFISNAVFEQADIQVMTDAYNRAIEDIYSFGRPNKTVEAIIATRIITLQKAASAIRIVCVNGLSPHVGSTWIARAERAQVGLPARHGPRRQALNSGNGTGRFP
jgi:hypothetical protein